MTFFKRKRKANQLYVVKTEIISSHYDEVGFGPRCVIQCFLAKKRNNCYYELFSGERLRLDREAYYNAISSRYFDVPYIIEVKAITEYTSATRLTDSELFYFITRMNTLNVLGAFDEDDECESDEDFEEEMSEEE